MSKVAKEVAEEYASSLSDLTLNSKPLINMLTMLAEENIMHAPIIVQAVEKHLQKVIFKVLFEFVASWGLGTSKCKLWLVKEFICTKENLIPALESSLLLLYAPDYLAAFEVEHSLWDQKKAEN